MASFAADTAAKTGKPERTIQRDATRAALAPDLDRIAGTSLDKGAELVRWQGWLPRRAEVIGRAVAGDEIIRPVSGA